MLSSLKTLKERLNLRRLPLAITINRGVEEYKYNHRKAIQALVGAFREVANNIL